MSESALMREIMVAVSKTGARVFRNNVGTLEWAPGKRLKYGLCVGSSDLIGWTKDGRFLAIEVKTGKGRVSNAQRAFLDAVFAAGGVAFVARSVTDATAFLKAFEPQTVIE